jgi:hypothetical protein
MKKAHVYDLSESANQIPCWNKKIDFPREAPFFALSFFFLFLYELLKECDTLYLRPGDISPPLDQIYPILYLCLVSPSPPPTQKPFSHRRRLPSHHHLRRRRQQRNLISI